MEVRLLISWWKHSRPSESYFLKSLQDLTSSYANVNIEVVSIVSRGARSSVDEGAVWNVRPESADAVRLFAEAVHRAHEPTLGQDTVHEDEPQ